MKASKIENLKEYETKDIAKVSGGADPEVTAGISFTLGPSQNWFDGSLWGNLFDGNPDTRPDLNEFDDGKVDVDVKV